MLAQAQRLGSTLILSSLALLVVLAPRGAGAEPGALAWASIGSERSVVDRIEFDAAELRALDARLARAQQQGDEAWLRLPPGDSGLPAALTRPQHFVLVTSRGSRRLPVTGWAVSAGASELHLLALLPGVPEWAGLEALALADGTVDPALRLHKLEGELVPARTRRGLRRYLDAAGRRALKSLPGPSLQRYRARFAGARDSLLALALPSEDPLEGVSGLLFLDAQGKVLRALLPPSLGLEHYSPLYRLDLDGDGLDELVLEASYYEGSYLYLLRWNGLRYELERLSGDGA